MNAIKRLQEQIERKQVELEQAQRQGNLEVAARIQYGETARAANASSTAAEKRAARADHNPATRW